MVCISCQDKEIEGCILILEECGTEIQVLKSDDKYLLNFVAPPEKIGRAVFNPKALERVSFAMDDQIAGKAIWLEDER